MAGAGAGISFSGKSAGVARGIFDKVSSVSDNGSASVSVSETSFCCSISSNKDICGLGFFTGGIGKTVEAGLRVTSVGVDLYNVPSSLYSVPSTLASSK